MAWDRDKERKAGKAMTLGSSIFGLVFAIFWCIAAASMGAWFMLIFGIPFVAMMIHRIYVISHYMKDEKPNSREAEPWERPVNGDTPHTAPGFCPYCGGSIQEGFEYCPKCGRRLG